MEKDLESNVLEKLVFSQLTEQKMARRWKIFFKLFWICIFIGITLLLFTNNKMILTKPTLAVISLSGVINADNQTYDIIKNGLENALREKQVKAVIIKANSPGGSPVYSDMLYKEILNLRKQYPQKPIDVVIEEVCASGCYYIASAAHNIYASNASIVGSIGVIYNGFGVNKLMDKLGIDSRLLISGKNKAMGYPFIDANKEQLEMQQEMLDAIHNQFINAVKHSRAERLHLDTVDLFSGRYWIGEQAYKIGLIDGIKTLDEVAEEQYHIKNVVDFTPNKDSFNQLMKKFGVELITFTTNYLTTLETKYPFK